MDTMIFNEESWSLKKQFCRFGSYSADSSSSFSTKIYGTDIEAEILDMQSLLDIRRNSIEGPECRMQNRPQPISQIIHSSTNNEYEPHISDQSE